MSLVVVVLMLIVGRLCRLGRSMWNVVSVIRIVIIGGVLVLSRLKIVFLFVCDWCMIIVL